MEILIRVIMIISAISFLISVTTLIQKINKQHLKRKDGFKPMNPAEEEAIKKQEGVDAILNPWLVRQHGISLKNVIEIKNLHRIRVETFASMEKTVSKKRIRELAKEVEDIEFELQDLWGFPRDSSFHRWFEVPKCTCPKLDNADNIGVKIHGENYRTINNNCPIHYIKKT